MNDAQVETSADLCAPPIGLLSDSKKTQQASESKRFKSIGLSGGVANNQSLRHSIENLCFGTECDFFLRRCVIRATMPR